MKGQETDVEERNYVESLTVAESVMTKAEG